VQITYLKQDKTIITLIESTYILQVLFENVPIWQLFDVNFTLAHFDEQADISFRGGFKTYILPDIF